MSELKDTVNKLETGGVQCNCDLDNWEPEKSTGHSHVCQIHKRAWAWVTGSKPPPIWTGSKWVERERKLI